MKKKVIAIAAAVAILLVLFLPIPRGTCEDGGTRVYSALTYKIVVWNRLVSAAGQDGSLAAVSTYHKISVFRFPDNFRSIDELWKIETADSGKINGGPGTSESTESVISIEETAEINESESDREIKNMIGGNSYVWEKEGFGSNFVITLVKDGTFSFYEGMWSSYIGLGNWTVKDGILTLTEKNNKRTYRCSAAAGALVFIGEGSDRFVYVSVMDGDKFIKDNSTTSPVIVPGPSD